jgi:hypothetical protein
MCQWGNRTFPGATGKQNDLRPSEKEPSMREHHKLLELTSVTAEIATMARR